MCHVRSRILGYNPAPGDNFPRRQPPIENTPTLEITPAWFGVLTLTDPRRGVLTLTRPTGRGIIWNRALTRIPDPNQPTTCGPDPNHNRNPNRLTGRNYLKTDTNPYFWP